MFTGIIRDVGRVRAASRHGESMSLEIDAGPLADQTAVGDSVNVDGVCLTVTAATGGQLTFDVGAETLGLTTLGGLRDGDRVNLEPALRVGDRLGGHFVSGHVDGTGVIRRLDRLPGEARLEVSVEPRLTASMILKGSVAVDGISLTIAVLRDGSFEVSLIPHTLTETTLNERRPGDRVNVECDTMGRWVRKLLEGTEREPGDTLTLEGLQEQGF